MDERENPYASPESPTETPPRRRTHRLKRLLIEAAAGIAIVLAILWLMSMGRIP